MIGVPTKSLTSTMAYVIPRTLRRPRARSSHSPLRNPWYSIIPSRRDVQLGVCALSSNSCSWRECRRGKVGGSPHSCKGGPGTVCAQTSALGSYGPENRGKGSVSHVAQRIGSETIAVSSARKNTQKEYSISLIYETIPSLFLPPFLPTATRIPCREALLTGRGGGVRAATLTWYPSCSSHPVTGMDGYGGEDA
jgi:hypothetical protein